jgi:hypothetical protein
MHRHHAIVPTARNLWAALNTLHAYVDDGEILTGEIDLLVLRIPTLDDGRPHLASRSQRYRKAGRMRRQYLEDRRAGRWPLPSTFLSQKSYPHPHEDLDPPDL